MEKNQILCQSTHCPLFLPFNVFKNSPLRPYLWSGGKWAKIMTVFKLNQIILCAIFPHSIHIAHHMIKLIHIFHKKVPNPSRWDSIICSRKGPKLSTEQNLLFSCVVNFSSQRKSYMAKEQKVSALGAEWLSSFSDKSVLRKVI